MKKINVWRVSTLVLAGALAFTLGHSQIGEAEAGKQPNMQAALKHLKKAKHFLKKAVPNKGGHRVKAAIARKFSGTSNIAIVSTPWLVVWIFQRRSV